MTRSILLFFAGIYSVLFMAVPPATAQDTEILLQLTLRDEYVMRSMKVIRKSGEAIPALLTVEAYDPVSKAFLFEDVAGVQKRVKASDLKQIEFVHDIVEQSPFAQEAAWKITVVRSEEKRALVSGKGLKIKSGIIYLRKKDLGTLTEKKGVIEVLNIIPVSSKNQFTIVLQNVQYTKTYFGGGGPSGIRKGLQ